MREAQSENGCKHHSAQQEIVQGNAESAREVGS